MTNRPSGDDDLNEMFSRLEREFNQRAEPPADAEVSARQGYGNPRQFGPPPDEPPQVGQATPIPRPPGRVRLRLPGGPPRVVYALIGINVVMYVVTMLLQNTIRLPYVDPFFGTRDGFTAALYVLGAKWGPAIDGGQYWRLLTPMILHGGLLHLAFNSYATYALGPEAERVYGMWRFLAVYVLAGLGGNIASYIVSPDALAIGASGAVFGLIGALAAFAYSARAVIGQEASEAQVRQLVGLAVVNLLLGFIVPNIDNSAHIGGLVVGGLAGLALAPRYVVDQRLYPPVLVAQGRTSLSIGATVLLLAVLILIAAGAIIRAQ